MPWQPRFCLPDFSILHRGENLIKGRKSNLEKTWYLVFPLSKCWLSPDGVSWWRLLEMAALLLVSWGHLAAGHWAVWDELGWSAARRLSRPNLYRSLTCIKLNNIIRKEAVHLAYFLIIFPFIAARICFVRYFVPRFLLSEELDWRDGKEEGKNGKRVGVLCQSARTPCRTLRCLFLKNLIERQINIMDFH